MYTLKCILKTIINLINKYKNSFFIVLRLIIFNRVETIYLLSKLCFLEQKKIVNLFRKLLSYKKIIFYYCKFNMHGFSKTRVCLNAEKQIGAVLNFWGPFPGSTAIFSYRLRQLQKNLYTTKYFPSGFVRSCRPFCGIFTTIIPQTYLSKIS